MKAGVLHGLGNLLPGFTGLVTAPLTARALGVTDRGTATVLMTVATLFSVAAAGGMGWGALTSVGRDPTIVGVWQRRARRVAAAATVPAAVLVAWFSGAWHLTHAEAGAAALLFAYAASTAIHSVHSNALVALGSIAAPGLSNILLAVVTAGSLVVLFALGELNLTTVILTNVAGLIVQAVTLFLVLRRTRRRFAKQSTAAPSDDEEKRPRSRLFMTAVAQTVDAASSRIDLLVVAIVADAQVIGLYSVAAVVPQVSYFVFLTLTQRSFARSPALPLEQRTRYLFLVSCAASVALAAVGGALSWLLIVPLFGEAFAPARHYLWPAMFVTVGLGALAPTLLAWQRGGRSASISLFALASIAVASVALGLIFGPWWAITGFGVGLVAMGLGHQVGRWGWGGLLRGHTSAWQSVAGGVA